MVGYAHTLGIVASVTRLRLSLTRYESRHSRLAFVVLVSGDTLALTTRGVLFLGDSPREKELWSAVMADDLILVVAPESDRFHVFACVVRGKGFVRQVRDDGLPFIVNVAIEGQTTTRSIRPAALFQQEIFAGRAPFQELWEACAPVKVEADAEAPWLWSEDPYTITVAQNDQDVAFVRDIAKLHPFGYREAFVMLIARRAGRRVGAALLQPAWSREQYHSAAWHVFRESYVWIREHAVEVLRLYSTHSASRWRVHRALLKGIAEVAPLIARRPLSIIEGVSYDFHPVAEELRYFIEVPRHLDGSFYYWKPFTLPAGFELPTDSLEWYSDVRTRAHDILDRRKRVAYWLAWVREHTLPQAMERSAWALRRNITNNGSWRTLAKGHIIFLTTSDGIVRAAGTVEATEIRTIAGLEEFPLWIDFASPVTSDIQINIRQRLKTAWTERMRGGGLALIPAEFGARINEAIQRQKRRGKMWVRPNPYLLHETDFVTIPRQVFVVQSAAFTHNVLPALRAVLEPLGYRVKYWGDRGGQLVFEDIWLLLNESEVVIVDFTDRRPNVYLEYGMALVLGKPIVAITQRKEDIPSDTPNLKCIVYNDKIGDKALHEQLPRAIEHTIADIERLHASRSTTV